MTIQAQAQEIDARNTVINWVNTVNDRVEACSYDVNSIDLRLRDLALDIIYGIYNSDRDTALKEISYLAEYTGSPDLMPPADISKVVKNLIFLVGE